MFPSETRRYASGVSGRPRAHPRAFVSPHSSYCKAPGLLPRGRRAPPRAASAARTNRLASAAPQSVTPPGGPRHV
eukprot:4683547-Pyramimonas_sp.AAC.1